MAIVGFNLDKISIERKEEITGKVSIKSNIDINNINKTNIVLMEGKDTLRATFTFFINYEPNLARLDFKGHVLIVEDAKTSKKIIEDWKKKKMDPKLREQVYNLILRKANIRALALEEELNLIPHWPMPSVKAQDLDTEKDKKA
jgi:Tfp pilus assembly protein PilN